MSEADRARWDEVYARRGPAAADAVGPPALLARFADVFPTAGRGLDVACGQGITAVWLARRGLDVRGIDISRVAVDQAQDLAARCGVGGRCRFEVADLDHGLPAGPPVDVMVCHRFRDRRLDRAMRARLSPGGLLAVVTLSEVGAEPGPFRATPGELPGAFAGLDLIAAGEDGGEAWLLARA